MNTIVFSRRHRYFIANMILLIGCVIITLLTLLDIKFYGNRMSNMPSSTQNNTKEVIIATVICGNRLQQGLVMLKSAIMFQGHRKLRFIIIAEYELQNQLHIELKNMNELTGNRFEKFTYQLLNVSFPEGKEEDWYKEFRPCATARLFLPNLVPDIDKVIYVDTDTIFVNKVSFVWELFHEMNRSHLTAMTLEDLEPNKSVYSSGQVKVPYFGKQGVNTGVMLMDLKKMRKFGLMYQVQLVFEIFKSKFQYGDQDILNIIFHYFPDKVYVIPCYYNYRSYYCTRTYTCREAATFGATILHGVNHTFETNSFPVLKIVHDTFRQYKLNQDPVTHLLRPLLIKFKHMPLHRCGKMNATIMKNMIRLFSQKNILHAV